MRIYAIDDSRRVLIPADPEDESPDLLFIWNCWDSHEVRTRPRARRKPRHTERRAQQLRPVDGSLTAAYRSGRGYPRRA
jgi:hypothetical protein